MQTPGNGRPLPRKQVVVIGLDGGTFDLIQPWAEAGHLPHLARLMSRGAWGRMRSTEPPHSAPAWTTFSTGLNPGRHGVYYFVAPSRDKNRFRPVSSATIRGRRLWQLVSDQGARVGIINVPMSYPMVPVNGYMIGDFFSPDARSAFDNPDLYAEVVRECGGYCVEAVQQPNRQTFLDDMLACIDQRAKVGAYLLEHHRVDFFALVFTMLDRAQHNFWADMDPEHPLHKKTRHKMIPGALLEVHKHIDAGIGRLLEKADSDATVIIMSDHGFRSEYRRMAVNKWLQEIGLLTARAGAAHAFSSFGMMLKRMGLADEAARVLRALIGTRRPESLYYRSVIWPETRVIYGPGQGFYINLKDRDHEGLVTQAEYEPLRDRIIEAMKGMRDPESGLPIVDQVLRREELYHGDAFDWAPDIVPTKAEYVSDGKRWGFGLSKFLGSPELFVNPRELSGTHSPEGMFIASGPQIRGGQELQGLHIVDVAPTAMYALGLTVPGSMDGKVRTDIFDPAHLAAHPVPYGEVEIAQAGKTGQVLSSEHEALVEKRLKDLGYL